MKKLVALLIGVGLIAGSAQADIILGWDVAALGTVDTHASVFNNANLSSSTLSIENSALVAATATNAFSMNNWSQGTTLASAISDNSYFSFTITPNAGYMFDVDSIAWRLSRSNTGPQTFALLSSVGGFTDGAVIDSLTRTTNTIVNLNPAFDNIGLADITTAVEFRIYGYNPGGAGGSAGSARVGDGGNFGANDPAGLDFAVFGSVTVIPEPGTAMLILLGFAAFAGRRKFMKAT
jgi:hypothetical protein